jgi:aminoglycoside 6'-N-acetyltransferase
MIRTTRLVLRAPREGDGVLVRAILAEPEVARFWPSAGDDPLASDEETTVLVVTKNDEVIGLVQHDEPRDEEYPHAGVDLFLTARVHGQGLGEETVRAVVGHLVETRGHHRVVIDPLVENVRAVRCYERVGFRRVGVLRKYERMPDGSFHDGLLMELLADDWRARAAREEDVAFLLSRMAEFNRDEGIAWSPATGAAPLRRLLADPALGRVYVLREGGERAGYAVVTYGYDLEFAGPDAFLTELWVDAGARRHGLARRALETILADLRSAGFGALHLQVRAENEAAQRLYRGLGFEGTTRLFLSKRVVP